MWIRRHVSRVSHFLERVGGYFQCMWEIPHEFSPTSINVFHFTVVNLFRMLRDLDELCGSRSFAAVV